MEQNWERSAELIRPHKNEIEHLFAGFDSALQVSGFRPVLKGCRSSNYIVETSGGKFFLRFSPDAGHSRNEKSAFDLLGKKINMPELLYYSSKNGRTVLIYEYIESESLDSLIKKNGTIPAEIIRQAARTAALIHNETPPAGLFFQENIPPFFTWYDYFLSLPAVRERLGAQLIERIQAYIKKQPENLKKTEADKTLIHCDFKTANMLAAPDGRLYVVDWEYTGPGHRVSDIGQFFRYKNCFPPDAHRIFENEYNSCSDTGLAANWYALSRLRDLANLLEMIGRHENAPVKFNGITETIRCILQESEELF